MDRQLKQRLVGASVLTALAIIFLPMLLDDRPSIDDQLADTNIPPEPVHVLSRNVLPETDLRVPPSTFESDSGVTVIETQVADATTEVVESTSTEEVSNGQSVLTTSAPSNKQNSSPAGTASEPKAPLNSDSKAVTQKPPVSAVSSVGTTGSKAQPVEVKPPVASDTREGLTAWVIQVGSFSTQEKADILTKKLKKGGFLAFSEQAYVNKKNVYRVRVGPELDRKNAEAMQVRMKKELKVSGIIVRYP